LNPGPGRLNRLDQLAFLENGLSRAAETPFSNETEAPPELPPPTSLRKTGERAPPERAPLRKTGEKAPTQPAPLRKTGERCAAPARLAE